MGVAGVVPWAWAAAGLLLLLLRAIRRCGARRHLMTLRRLRRIAPPAAASVLMALPATGSVFLIYR